MEGLDPQSSYNIHGPTHFPHTIDNFRLGNIHFDNQRSPC
jgi:hypothetical protein